jgi:hypothetical protein
MADSFPWAAISDPLHTPPDATKPPAHAHNSPHRRSPEPHPPPAEPLTPIRSSKQPLSERGYAMVHPDDFAVSAANSEVPGEFRRPTDASVADQLGVTLTRSWQMADHGSEGLFPAVGPRSHEEPRVLRGDACTEDLAESEADSLV